MINLSSDLALIVQKYPTVNSKLAALFQAKSMRGVWLYRVAHDLWSRNKKSLALRLHGFAASHYQVDIHPAARIGNRFLLISGEGVFIGETAVIGENVMLHSGVILGEAETPITPDLVKLGKHHPTIGNNVIVESGAQILGNVIVGNGARVLAGATVSKDVPAYHTASNVNLFTASKI